MPCLPSARPDAALLSEWAPLAAWHAAYAEAEHSPMYGYGVGAVLLDPDSSRILSRGCAHKHTLGDTSLLASVHAEQHALNRVAYSDLRGTQCLVVALNAKRERHVSCARPCASCARALHARGVHEVLFAERSHDGGWLMRCERVSALARAAAAHCQQTRHARLMRLDPALLRASAANN